MTKNTYDRPFEEILEDLDYYSEEYSKKVDYSIRLGSQH